MQFLRINLCLLIIFLMAGLVFESSATADTFDDSYLTFDAPSELEPDSEYEFVFTVYNMERFVAKNKVAEWIYAVDLMMPSNDYYVATDDIDIPDALHPDDDYPISKWNAYYDPNSMTISWVCASVNTSATFGDIREEETLSFSFLATTDAKASDGFAWTIYGDLGTDLQGIVYIGTEPDDDDDSDSGDDDSSGDDDMDDWNNDGEDELSNRLDDEDSNGCGC